nr:MAG TPA: hypothetical protein [Caudoviricetes sp.]
MEITLGFTIAKPVATQEECTAYAAMAEAVNAHNDGNHFRFHHRKACGDTGRVHRLRRHG